MDTLHFFTSAFTSKRASEHLEIFSFLFFCFDVFLMRGWIMVMLLLRVDSLQQLTVSVHIGMENVTPDLALIVNSEVIELPNTGYLKASNKIFDTWSTL